MLTQQEKKIQNQNKNSKKKRSQKNEMETQKEETQPLSSTTDMTDALNQ